MSANTSARLGYSDFLRCLAALAVVVLHCIGAPLTTLDPSAPSFFGLNIVDSLCRWAAPMFVMLSGMFLLDPGRPMSRRKWLAHLGKIALIILLWGGFYALWDARSARVHGAEWPLETLIILVTGRFHYHLWFLPMLLLLYLLIPPLRALIQRLSRRALWWTVGLLEAVAITVRTLRALYPGAFPPPWLDFLDLGTAAGYPGLFLLGYLLKTCELRPRLERTAYALGLAGLAITIGGTQALSLAAGSFQDPFYSYFSPNLILTLIALFLLARRLDLGKAPIWGRLAPLTFGVYLVHPFFLELFRLGLKFPSATWSPFWSVFVQAPVVAAAALAATWVLRRIPKLGKRIC